MKSNPMNHQPVRNHLTYRGFSFPRTFMITLGFAGVFFILLHGCVKNELEEREADEKKIISTYLASHPGFTKTEGGIYVQMNREGNGLTPSAGEFIFINYVGKYLEDEVIRETSYDSLKSLWPISGNLTNYLYGPLKTSYGDKMPGINEALALLKEGGKGTFIIPSDKANFDQIPLLYEIELLKVIGDPVAFEDSVLTIFAQENFSETDRFDTLNVWMKITESSESPLFFGTGDTLYFSFVGKLVDHFGTTASTERIFDSNQLKLIYNLSKPSSGKILNGTIPSGLRIALDSIQNGIKASVLLGYDQAYGEEGIEHSVNEYTIIPPYQTVVYDIEITDIKIGGAR
jgi:FKBP-type peptidyl-prolyl cis-trans isomerase